MRPLKVFLCELPLHHSDVMYKFTVRCAFSHIPNLYLQRGLKRYSIGIFSNYYQTMVYPFFVDELVHFSRSLIYNFYNRMSLMNFLPFLKTNIFAKFQKKKVEDLSS